LRPARDLNPLCIHPSALYLGNPLVEDRSVANDAAAEIGGIGARRDHTVVTGVVHQEVKTGLPKSSFNGRVSVRSCTASLATISVEIKQTNGDVHGEACFTYKSRAWIQVTSPHRGHSILVFSKR
jgi:chemotaxis protein CheY-P-specific phosphatase CheC